MPERNLTHAEYSRAVRIGFQHARTEYDGHGFDGEDAFRDTVHPYAFDEALDAFDECTAVDISDAVDQGIRDFLASPDFLNDYPGDC